MADKIVHATDEVSLKNQQDIVSLEKWPKTECENQVCAGGEVE